MPHPLPAIAKAGGDDPAVAINAAARIEARCHIVPVQQVGDVQRGLTPFQRRPGSAKIIAYGAIDQRDGRNPERIARGDRRFVLVYPQRDREEAHSDRVARGQWLKRNKAALAARCLALIVVEPDAARRAGMEAMFPNLVKAFGTPQATRATAAEAESLARFLVTGGALAEAATVAA